MFRPSPARLLRRTRRTSLRNSVRKVEEAITSGDRGAASAALKNADCVVCVYRFIEPYARRMGARRIEVIYNVVGGGAVAEKREEALKKTKKKGGDA